MCDTGGGSLTAPPGPPSVSCPPPSAPFTLFDKPVIIGIETSCDETAAAIVSDDGGIRADVVWSQQEIHSRFGGVVPELACRRHIETIDQVVRETLSRAGIGVADLTAVAVTSGPGLIGALLVGVAYGKALAYARNIPMIPVNHLEGHLSAAALCAVPVHPPFIALIASGGHTSLYHVKGWDGVELLGQTLDDAAGEAFDKAAKMLGFGYPGGPIIDQLAQTGHATPVRFPKPYPSCDDLNFSFSGLKTALLYYLRDQERSGMTYDPASVAAGYQHAIVEVLVDKTLVATERLSVRNVVVTGGVAANSELRARFMERGAAAGVGVYIPPLKYCTDNAAMIAVAGLRLARAGRTAGLAFEPQANWTLEQDAPQ
jgi:N6-L-threonylcarbamoyladenine synthase